MACYFCYLAISIAFLGSERVVATFVPFSDALAFQWKGYPRSTMGSRWRLTVLEYYINSVYPRCPEPFWLDFCLSSSPKDQPRRTRVKGCKKRCKGCKSQLLCVSLTETMAELGVWAVVAFQFRVIARLVVCLCGRLKIQIVPWLVWSGPIFEDGTVWDY